MPGMPVTYELLPSAARTVTENSVDHGDSAIIGGVFLIAATVVPGSAPSTVFTIQGKDTTSGQYYDIVSSAAITAVTTAPVAIVIHPGVTPAANLAVATILPNIWRVRAVHGNANSVTYSVSVQLKDQG